MENPKPPEPSHEPSLEAEAGEWKPEQPIAFVPDPLGSAILDVTEAQGSEDELDLDSELESDLGPPIPEKSPEEVEQEMSRLADAVATQVDIDQAAATAIALPLEEAPPEESSPEEPAAEGHEAPAIPLAQELDQAELESCVEALLFISDKPLSALRLRELLGPDAPLSIFQEAITSLRDRYAQPHHGIEVIEVAGGLQFRTKPGRAALARKLAKIQTQRLSAGAMESLALVAYKQPCMKEDIDRVRGVDSSHYMRILLERELIRVSGRSELPGRPMLYDTTPKFLELFGLKNSQELPGLREIEEMVPASEAADEDPRVPEMRRLVGEMTGDTRTRLVYDPREDEKILREIRERVGAIPTSTPFLDQQRAQEAAALAEAAAGPVQPELPPAAATSPAEPAPATGP